MVRGMCESSCLVCWIIWKQKSSLHFCQECNNLLYPKADPQRRIMVYGCRICQYDELVDNKCVYRNDLLTVTKYVLRLIPTIFHEHIFQRTSRYHDGFGRRCYAGMLSNIVWLGPESHSRLGSFKYFMPTLWSWWVSWCSIAYLLLLTFLQFSLLSRSIKTKGDADDSIFCLHQV